MTEPRRETEPCPECGTICYVRKHKYRREYEPVAPAPAGLLLREADVRGLNDAARTLIEALDRHGLNNLALFEQQIEHLRGHLFSDALLAATGDSEGPLDVVARYVALHEPDGECNGKCSAWAALKTAARLSSSGEKP